MLYCPIFPVSDAPFRDACHRARSSLKEIQNDGRNVEERLMPVCATLSTPDEGCGREPRGEQGRPFARPPKVKGSREQWLPIAESLRQKDRKPEGRPGEFGSPPRDRRRRGNTLRFGTGRKPHRTLTRNRGYNRVTRFTPHTEEDIREMLEASGVDTLDDLFADVPPKLEGELALPPVLSEYEALSNVNKLAAENAAGGPIFLGAGAYDRIVPSAVGAIISRGEFLTSYTPYQPEISQGVLQSIFEYQSVISELTGFEISNASVYDGASAVAEAALMTARQTKRDPKVAVPATARLSRPTSSRPSSCHITVEKPISPRCPRTSRASSSRARTITGSWRRWRRPRGRPTQSGLWRLRSVVPSLWLFWGRRGLWGGAWR